MFTSQIHQRLASFEGKLQPADAIRRPCRRLIGKSADQLRSTEAHTLFASLRVAILRKPGASLKHPLSVTVISNHAPYAVPHLELIVSLNPELWVGSVQVA